MQDENSTAAVSLLLPSEQVVPLTSCSAPAAAPLAATGAAQGDWGRAQVTPFTSTTTTSTNAVMYRTSPQSSSASHHPQHHVDVQPARPNPLLPASYESDSNEEPLFQHPPPAIPTGMPFHSLRTAGMAPHASPQAASQQQRATALGGGGTMPYASSTADLGGPLTPGDAVCTPAGQSLPVGRDVSNCCPPPAPVKTRVFGSLASATAAAAAPPRVLGSTGTASPTEADSGSPASFASGGVGRGPQRPLFTPGPSSTAGTASPSAASPVLMALPAPWSRGVRGEEGTSSGTPATPLTQLGAVTGPPPPTPAKQRRTIHASTAAGSGGGIRTGFPGSVMSGPIGGGWPRLSLLSTASSSAAGVAAHTTSATATGTGGGSGCGGGAHPSAAAGGTSGAVSPKLTSRMLVPPPPAPPPAPPTTQQQQPQQPHSFGYASGLNSGGSAAPSRAATPALGTVAFKFLRREGSRKRSADVLSQFSALDLDETPATPCGQVGTDRTASIPYHLAGHSYTNSGGGGAGVGCSAFPSQPSPSTMAYRGGGGHAMMMGPVSPLMMEYATPVTLSQQIGGSNTFSQLLLHQSQDVLEMSQADTECSNFLARRILNEYNEVRRLGSGSFGTVSLYKEISSGDYVAVKTSPPLESLEMARRYRRERSVMGMVRGMPHVVQLSAAWEEGRVPRMYLQLEYCPGGSVAAIAAEKQRLGETWTEAEVKTFLAHLCIALDALHRANIAHVDVKPDNVLVDRDGAYKLSDFGCSVWLDERGRPRPETQKGYGSPARAGRPGAGPSRAGATAAGSPIFQGGAVDFGWCEGNEPSVMSVDEGDCRYLCADMLNNKLHIKAGDMFSLGMSVFELMSGQPLPRSGDYYQLLRRRVPVEALQRRGYSTALIDLVVCLLRGDPPQRPTAREVLQRLRPSPSELALLASPVAMREWTESAAAFERLVDAEGTSGTAGPPTERDGKDASAATTTPSTTTPSIPPRATVDALRCVSALMEASTWLLTTTQQDQHRRAAHIAAGQGDEQAEESRRHAQQPPHRPPPPPPSQLQHQQQQQQQHRSLFRTVTPQPSVRLEEAPMSPATRNEACTPTTLTY